MTFETKKSCESKRTLRRTFCLNLNENSVIAAGCRFISKNLSLIWIHREKSRSYRQTKCSIGADGALFYWCEVNWWNVVTFSKKDFTRLKRGRPFNFPNNYILRLVALSYCPSVCQQANRWNCNIRLCVCEETCSIFARISSLSYYYGSMYVL